MNTNLTINRRHIPNKAISFFLVGCWNRGVVDEQRLVFDKIIELQDSMDMLLILGDNVYSNADSKLINVNNSVKQGNSGKQHSMNVYERGIAGIQTSSTGQQLKKPVYFVLGNHDVSTRQQDCSIYNKQIVLKDKDRLFTGFPYYSEIITNIDHSLSVKLVCIDTNFADLGVGYNGNSCINSTNKESLIKQLQWLEEELSRSTCDYILIMGHHPIVFNKMKGTSLKEDYIKPLIELFGKYAHKNITYICADNHMYQDWTLKYQSGHTVHQIVCGTGGAILDQGGNPKNNFIKDHVLYIRDHEVSKTNGFCQLLFNKTCKTTRFFDVYKHL